MCNVTQPTLSAGIKQLEESLGVLIVERGQRFLGLTAEGERVLARAQRVLIDYSGLQQGTKSPRCNRERYVLLTRRGGRWATGALSHGRKQRASRCAF
jgi:DNA-binding transcriptional LysR family regulator